MKPLVLRVFCNYYTPQEDLGFYDGIRYPPRDRKVGGYFFSNIHAVNTFPTYATFPNNYVFGMQ
jgi:hypothetical protein